MIRTGRSLTSSFARLMTVLPATAPVRPVHQQVNCSMRSVTAPPWCRPRSGLRPCGFGRRILPHPGDELGHHRHRELQHGGVADIRRSHGVGVGLCAATSPRSPETGYPPPRFATARSARVAIACSSRRVEGDTVARATAPSTRAQSIDGAIGSARARAGRRSRRSRRSSGPHVGPARPPRRTATRWSRATGGAHRRRGRDPTTSGEPAEQQQGVRPERHGDHVDAPRRYALATSARAHARGRCSASSSVGRRRRGRDELGQSLRVTGLEALLPGRRYERDKGARGVHDMHVRGREGVTMRGTRSSGVRQNHSALSTAVAGHPRVFQTSRRQALAGRPSPRVPDRSRSQVES